MNTERADELLKKFKNGISHDPKKGLDDILDWQDVIGHSSMQEIAEFEGALDQDEKKHFVWVNFLTLSHDLSVDILLKTVIKRKTERIIAGYEEDIKGREDTLFENEMKLQSAKKSIYKKIASLRKDNARLRKESNTNLAGWMRANTSKANVKYLKEKAVKFDELKALLELNWRTML